MFLVLLHVAYRMEPKCLVWNSKIGFYNEEVIFCVGKETGKWEVQDVLDQPGWFRYGTWGNLIWGQFKTGKGETAKQDAIDQAGLPGPDLGSEVLLFLDIEMKGGIL